MAQDGVKASATLDLKGNAAFPRGAPLEPSMSFVRKTLLLVGGIGGAQAVTLLAAPVLSRIYTPGDFGTFGIFVAIVSIGSVLVTGRYDLALVISRSSSERHGLVALMLAMASAAFLLFITGWTVLVVTGGLSTLVGPVVGSWGVLLSVALVFQALQFTGRALALKEQSFGTISTTKIGGASIQAAVQILVGLAFSGAAIGLPLGMTGSLVFIGAWFAWAATRDEWVDFGRYRPMRSRMVAAARRYDEFPKFMTWSALANSAAPQTVVLMMGALVSPAVAGQIFLAQRALKAPLALLARAIQDINFQEMSEVTRGRLLGIYRRRVAKLLLVGALPFGLLMAAAPAVFEVVFGSVWREAGIYTRILVPGLYLQFVFTPFCPLFTVLRRQGLYLAWSYFRLVSVVLMIWVGHSFLDARGAVAGFALATGVSFLLLHALLSRSLRDGSSIGRGTTARSSHVD